MKKITLSICLIFTAFTDLKSQDSIVIKVKNAYISVTSNQIDLTSDLTIDFSSGHSPLIINANETGLLELLLNVENNTLSDKQWRLKRIIENGTNSDWNSSFSFESSCFSFTNTSPYCTPENSFTQIYTPSGGSDDIQFHINMLSYGMGKYKLFLGDCDTDEDSIEIYINNYIDAGLFEKNELFSFAMYPNPSNNQFTIQLKNSTKSNVKIIDLIGNIVYSEIINSTSIINTTELKNGIYFVEMETDGVKSHAQKLEIKH